MKKGGILSQPYKRMVVKSGGDAEMAVLGKWPTFANM